MNLVKNKLRVEHFAQVPCKPFIVPVGDEFEAFRIIDILAKQHLFLFEQKIIPDYANTFIVTMEEDGEWVDYYNDDEGFEWDGFEEHYIHSDIDTYNRLKL